MSCKVVYVTPFNETSIIYTSHWTWRQSPLSPACKKDCSETFGSGNIRCKTEETDGHEKGGKNAKLCRGTEKQ